MGYGKQDGNGRNTATRDEPKQRPVDEVRFGKCKVVVWSNQTKTGTMLNFKPVRLYKKDGDDRWQETDSLGVGDLLPMAQALEEAYRRATSPSD